MEFLRSFLRHQRALDLTTRTTTSARFKLKCFRIFSKNVQSFIVLFFTWKVSAVIFIGDSSALSPSQNDWPGSCHHDIPAKSRSRMTTAGYHVFPPKWRGLTREHYSVLKNSRTRTGPCLRIESSLSFRCGNQWWKTWNVGYFLRLANRRYY